MQKAHFGKNDKGQISVIHIELNPGMRFDTGFAFETTELEHM